MKKSTTTDLRRVKAEDILTAAEQARVASMFEEHGGAPSFAAKVVYDVLPSILPRINASLGLDCDPWDLAYALEYGLFKRQKRRSPSE